MHPFDVCDFPLCLTFSIDISRNLIRVSFNVYIWWGRGVCTGTNLLVETGLMLFLCARDVSGGILVAKNLSVCVSCSVVSNSQQPRGL